MSDHPLQDFYRDIHGSYDRINRIFTFGRDSVWRRKAAAACLEGHPSEVLDVCSGTGDFILELARQVRGGDHAPVLTAYDFSAAMLEEARKKHEMMREREGAPPVDFVEGEVGQMPFGDDRFDAMGITFGIRNLLFENPAAQRHLEELLRVLKPGGCFVILESSRPENPVWRMFNNIYLRVILPYLGGILSGHLKAYQYLARSSRNYYSVSEMSTILENAGFSVLRTRSFFLGSVMMVIAGKKASNVYLYFRIPGK
jgi:demethylmenaquinone methyltransferase/2-methoxy-6-polyprenyl-1,4-benzoquinol methylase